MPVPDKYFSSESSVDIANNEASSEAVNLPEQNTLGNIESQLDAFEKLLLNDYNAQNMLPESDLKLPMLVIDSFSKIFRLWHENSVLKNSIQSTVFYDIFSLMFRSLNEEPTANNEQTGEKSDVSNLTGICDICDEEFELIQNDAIKSFAEHERTAAHIEAVQLFNQIGTSDETVDNDLKQGITMHPHNENNNERRSVEKSQSTEINIDNVWKQNSYFLKLLDENTYDFECYLCDITCSNINKVIDHCSSKKHKRHKSYFLTKSQSVSRKRIEFNDDLIFSRGQYFYCVLCQCIQHKQHRDAHITGEYHIGWKHFARKVINLEQPYIFRINQKSDMCFCELCKIKFNMMNSIIPHCQTKNHISLKRFADEILCLYSQ